MRKILRMESCVHIRRRDPSFSRAAQGADEHPESGTVDEGDLLKVHDDIHATVIDDGDETVLERRRRVDIHLAR